MRTPAPRSKPRRSGYRAGNLTTSGRQRMFPRFLGFGSAGNTTSSLHFLLWYFFTSDSTSIMQPKDQANKTKSMKKKTGRAFDECLQPPARIWFGFHGKGPHVCSSDRRRHLEILFIHSYSTWQDFIAEIQSAEAMGLLLWRL